VLDGAGEPTGETKELFLVCQPISLGQNPGQQPRYTRTAHLPYVGGTLLPYCFQLTAVEIDFHASDQIALPPELSPLPTQNFVTRIEACFGLACPDLETTSVPIWEVLRQRIFPATKLDCFCLSALFSGQFTVRPATDTEPQKIGVEMRGFELVDLQPAGLEAILEGHVRLLLHGFVLPQLVLPLKEVVFGILQTTITITPFLTPGLPFNPAVEDNQLKIFLDWEVTSE
jgi:hypothetical protein